MKHKLFTLLLAVMANASMLFAQSGTCGDNLTWDLTDGVLTISGTGSMWSFYGTSYASTSTAPWYSSRSSISSVVIPEGVTNIGSKAFAGCTGLASITIPNSVTSIEDRAFEDCTGLTSVHISDIAAWCAISFSSDDANPLYNAHNLYLNGVLVTDLIIPNGITRIKDYTFTGCTSLISLTIPNSVTRIGHYAFEDCSSLTSVTIPNSVTSIGYYAFYGCSGLTSVTIPNSVTSILSSAFSQCTGLTSVTIPNSVTSIGDYAFSSVLNIIYEGTATGSPWGAKNINKYAEGWFVYTDESKTTLIGCSKAAEGEIVIPNSVTSIGTRAFSGCTKLTSVMIPNSVTTIGEYAFSSVPNILYSGTATGAPWGAKSVNGYVEGWLIYSDASKTTLLACFGAAEGEIVIPNSVTTIAENAFYGCEKSIDVTIPNGIASIGKYAFYRCLGLTSITIPNSVTSIGDEAFYDCSGLTSIVIPENLTSMGEFAFNGCTGLTSVVWNAKNCKYTYKTTPNGPFWGCNNITTFTIGENVTNIPHFMCYGLPITSLTIPYSVTSISSEAFAGCTSLTSIVWNAKNCSISSGNSSPFDSNYDISDHVPPVTSVVFGDQVEYIPAYLCYGMTQLTSVTIPNSVTSIGNNAFSNCSKLTRLNISDIAAWCAINFASSGSNPLSYIQNLYVNDELITDLVIPDRVTKIGNYAFYGYKRLTSVTIPSSVTSIGNNAFSSCTNLLSVTINGNISNMENNVFSSCSNLNKVYWNVPNADISESLFPTNIDSLIIGENVEEVGFRTQPQYYFTFLNPMTRVRSHATPKLASFYDYNHDGVMEFIDTVSYKTNGSYNYNVRYKNLFGFYACDDLLETANLRTFYDNIQTINLNNDTLIDFINGSTLYQANSNGGYDKIELDYTKSVYTDHLFALDADLNGTTDFYSNEGGTHYLHLRQFDGSYQKIKMNVISETAEVDSAIYAKWDKPKTGIDAIIIVEDHFPSLKENMFLPNVSNSDDFKTIDVAVDLDKNGLVDLLSTSTGAVLYNLGNNKYLRGRFPGAVTIKDMNNDGIEDFVIYDESTKTVSLQIYSNEGSYQTITLMQNMNISNVWCFDFDNDGDVDILLPFDWTSTSGYAYLVFFRNDGNNTFKKVETAFDDPIKHFQFLDCRDVDNDGKYEIIARDSLYDRGESLKNGNYYLIRYNNRLKATMDAEPFAANTDKYLDKNSPFIYGDFDNDGTNDCYYQKEVEISYNKYYYYAVLSHFANTKINTAPQKMSAPQVIEDAASGKLLVSWNQGNDAETPDIDLVYSLRIGSAPGLGDMWYASALNDGRQTSLNAANIGSRLSQIVNVSGWKSGDYYISVQAIDPNGLGGQWSDEVVYHHSLPSPTFNTNTTELTTADTLFVQYAGMVDNAVSYIWNFGDSATILSSDEQRQVYEIVYNTAGIKTISLQLASTDGRTSAIYSVELTVYPMKLGKENPGAKFMSYFDMDMDGQMDAIGHYSTVGSNVTQQGFFKGKPDGSFIKLAKTYNTDLAINNRGYLRDSCIFADFNMDGLPDVQWSTNKGTVMYNREDFDVEFSNETFTLPCTEEKYDFNGDGIDDEVKVKNKYALAIILNGEKKDTIELDLPSGYTLWPDHEGGERNPHVQDVNNDGFLDFIVTPYAPSFFDQNQYIIYLNEDWSYYIQDIPKEDIYNYSEYYDLLIGYPFVDLNSDGTPDFRAGHFMQSRITNEVPSVPTNLRVVQENEGVFLYWDAAKDKETPATRMRYNISVKKQGVAVGTDNAFIVSPMNGLYDEANIVPGHVYPHGTTYFIPIDKFTGGQTYEFQIQSIDLWNAHSPMSAAYTFTVQPQVLISMPANTCINEPVTVAYTGTNNGAISWNFNGGTVSQNSDGTYSVSWSTEGIKTVTATIGGNTSSRVIYVQNAEKDLTFTLPERVLNNSWVDVTLPENYLNLENLAIRASDNCTGYVLPKKDSHIFRVRFNGTSANDSEIGWIEFYQNHPICGEVNTFRDSTTIVGNGNAPAISLVMVDATTGKNMVTWDAPANLPAYVDSVIVYKEEGKTNNWIKQAKLPVSAGQWIDNASDPSVKSNSYCIAYTSIYGGESPKSKPHKTPHLQTNYGLNGAINLYWTSYEGDVVDSYQIMRGSSASSLQVLTTVAGNECTYTDNSPLENGYYAIAYSNEAFTEEWISNGGAANAPAHKAMAQARQIRTGQSNIKASAASIQTILATHMTILSMEKTYTLSPSQQILHLYVEIMPFHSTYKQVRWSIVSGLGLATIYSNGLLVANTEGRNGTVRVRATAIDGSGVYAERDINVTGFKRPLSLFVNDAEMGYGKGAGNYSVGQIVSISAIAYSGYHFVQWNDGNTDNPRTIVFMRDTAFTAEFAKNSYNISAITLNDQYGTTSGSDSALYQDQVTISATPADCYRFDKWNDGNTDNPRIVTVTENKTYIAYFAKATYTITKIVNEEQGGIYDQIGGYGPTEVECQESIKLIPIPTEGYHFAGWTDGVHGNPRTVIITQDTTFGAEFAKNIYTISTGIPYYQDGWGTITGGGEYEHGSTAVITAVPNYGYHFKYWNDDNTENPRTITATENTYFSAYFAKNTYSITVEYDTEQGTVKYPSEAEYLKNVKLYATPNTGYRFVQWNDGETRNSRSVVITQDTTFTAEFEPIKYTITFQDNNGTIIDQVEYDYGTMPAPENPVKPSNGIYSYTFTGWMPELTPVTGNATYTAQYDTLKTSSGECEDIHEIWLQTGRDGLGEIVSDNGLWGYHVNEGATIYGTNYDFLRTPAKDLSNMSSVTLSFSHVSSNISTQDLTLLVCADFKDREDDEWQELTIPRDNGGYTTAVINVKKQYVGENTVFGFSYGGANVSYAYWFIKDLQLDAICEGSTPPQPTYYTIRFLNWDGTVLQSSQVEEGNEPSYTGATPVRPEDEQYTYWFDGWSPTIVAAAANADYIATYTVTTKPQPTYYTIRFLNWDGTVLQSNQVEEGDMPAYDGTTPVRPEDENYTYSFKGWSPTIVAATADADYTATYTATEKNVSGCQDIHTDWLTTGESDWGEMSTNNAEVWTWNSRYGAVSTKRGGVTAWLLTPQQDLNEKENITLSFSHAHRYAVDFESEMTLWVSAEYQGSVEASSWLQLPITPYASNTSWTYVDVVVNVPVDKVGEHTVFGFKYTSTADNYATWEIRNLHLDAQCSEVPTSIENTTQQSTDIVRKVLIDNKIYILRGEKVYTITGQEVR